MEPQEAIGLESFPLTFTCPFKYLWHFGDLLSQVEMEAVEYEQFPATQSLKRRDFILQKHKDFMGYLGRVEPGRVPQGTEAKH